MTREEAIKEAYGIPVTKAQHEALQMLIPELKESEDEKTRKSLIKFLTDIKEISESGRTTWAVREDDAEMCKSFLTYLENQKEQNPIDIDFVSDWLRKHIKTYINSEYNEFHKAVEYDGSIDIEHLIEDLKKATDVADCSEKQKEQDKCPEPGYCVRSHCIGCSIYEKQKKQKPILEVFGFKVGDAVRLKDGDGRKHIIKSFEEVEGLHGPNFYHVEFEDNSARDGIYPGEEYPNGYYTQMEKFEEEQKPIEASDDELQRHLDELYDFQVFATKQAREHNISFSCDHDFEWHNFCAELLSYLNEKQKPAEWTEDDETLYNNVLDGLKYAYEDLTDNNSYDTADCVRRAFEWMKYRFKKN